MTCTEIVKFFAFEFLALGQCQYIHIVISRHPWLAKMQVNR